MATNAYFGRWLDEMNGCYHDHGRMSELPANHKVAIFTKPFNARGKLMGSAITRAAIEVDERAAERVLPKGACLLPPLNTEAELHAALASLRDGTAPPRMVSPDELVHVSHAALQNAIRTHAVHIASASRR
jgi:hypothetical protein